MRKLATFAAMAAIMLFAGAGFLRANTFVIPHVLEKSGSVNTVQYTFDTTIFATYAGGLAGTVDQAAGAKIDFYLFDQTGGGVMQGAGGDICNPCTFNMSSQNRKQPIKVDALLEAKGGFNPNPVRLGFGVLVVTGAGADFVNFTNFVVNSHTGAFDLSVFGSTPEALKGAAQ